MATIQIYYNEEKDPVLKRLHGTLSRDGRLSEFARAALLEKAHGERDPADLAGRLAAVEAKLERVLALLESGVVVREDGADGGKQESRTVETMGFVDFGE